MKCLDLLPDTKRAILRKLKEGPKDVESLSRELGIRKSAVRGHLEALEGMGLISSQVEKGKVGRPKKLYGLSDEGEELFERRYDLLLERLLRGLLDLYGEEHLDNLMRGVAREVLKPSYHPSLEEALKSLLEWLKEFGFEPELSDDKIISWNCPIYRVARSHPGLVCDSFHTYMLRSYLGVEVELSESRAKGGRRCVHSISPKNP